LFDLIDTVSLAPRQESIGNFNPMFVTYRGNKYLLHSDEGDLSDPFRREESYAKSFFIKL
jgi:hypothetical protein